MASQDVVQAIINMTANFMQYMLPIIGVLGGLSFVISLLFSTVFGLSRRTIKG
jgi:hypothetical protein